MKTNKKEILITLANILLLDVYDLHGIPSSVKSRVYSLYMRIWALVVPPHNKKG